MKTLIGSAAAKYFFPDFREPKDKDYIISHDELRPVGNNIEWQYPLCDGHKFILTQGEIANPEILYSIKLSHCFWDVHWDKTIDDILFFQSKNVKYNVNLFNSLYDCWVFYNRSCRRLERLIFFDRLEHSEKLQICKQKISRYGIKKLILDNTNLSFFLVVNLLRLI